MAMPAMKTQWPPQPFDLVFRDIEEWAVWWAGTSTKLTNFYSGRGQGYNTMPRGWKDRITGAGESFFGRQDGRNITPPEVRLHLPIPGSIARKKANMLFSTPPQFTTAVGSDEDVADAEIIDAESMDDQNPTQARIDLLVNTEITQAQFLEAAEGCSALGGVYVRVVWDIETVNDRAFLDVVDADCALPEFRWGKLVAVTFWSEIGTTSDGKTIRHLERYIPGYIEHAVYIGDATDVGMTVPLIDSDVVDVYDFSDIIENMDETGAVPTGYDGVAAVYIPNRTPNPTWRKNPQTRHLGYSDFSMDVIPIFAAIDEVWTSLVRDVRQAKGRLIVSENLLDILGPGKGSGFDMNREIFSPVGETLDDDGKALIEQVQFNIRVTEHLDTIRALILEVLKRVGISPLSFGMSENVATTATEVKAWTADTLDTQDASQRVWGPRLCEIVTALITIDGVMFPTTAVPLDEQVEIQWPPSVEESDLERAQTVALWEQAGAASTKTKIQKLHPEWDPQDLQSEVDAISEEKAAAMPPALADPFGGGESGGDPTVDSSANADANAADGTANAAGAANGKVPAIIGKGK